MKNFLLIYRHLVGQPQGHALVAANETFLIAPHAVGAAKIETVRRRAVFVVSQLAVQPRREHLPVFIFFLVHHVQTVAHITGAGLPVAGTSPFKTRNGNTVLMVQNAAVPVMGKGNVRSNRISFILCPVANSPPPGFGVLVQELDANGKEVARTYTDQGMFSFNVVKPGNTIKVSTSGFEPFTAPIDIPYYSIVLNEN